MIQFDEKFDGHIILYCKGYYRKEGVSFFEGLRRIWAVRCGLPIDAYSYRFDEHIADKLYELFVKCKPTKLSYFHQILHKELVSDWKYTNLTPIERVIVAYRNELLDLKVKDIPKKHKNLPLDEQIDKRYTTLIKLPKPQKRIFNRIVSGKAERNDYKLIK